MSGKPGVGAGEGVGAGDASGAGAGRGLVVDIWGFLPKSKSSSCLM